MAYEIIDQTIVSDILEVNVVDHCNLRCRSCSHLSPIAKKNSVVPSLLLDQLSALTSAYHARKIRLLGGEPLLHSDLDGVIDAVRESGVADSIVIVTNGQLPQRITAHLLDKIDALEVSVYPTAPVRIDFNALKQSCIEHDCSLRITEYSQFRESHSGCKGSGEMRL